MSTSEMNLNTYFLETSVVMQNSFNTSVFYVFLHALFTIALASLYRITAFYVPNEGKQQHPAIHST